ncbi:MAG TPA: hypothetical protein PLU43_12610, partial [Lachnospiraceae bacterium]|nr:hypothetical protein [Lachnospiraceae bacterium]
MKKNDTVVLKQSQKQIYFILAAVSLTYFLYMLCFCNLRSLWVDDLAQIEIAVQPSIIAMLKETIFLDNNPPLFHLISYFWIRLAPYGTGWLKLPGMVFASIGLYVCGLTAYRLFGKPAALFCVAMGFLQKGLVSLAAYTFRPYGLYFCLLSFMLFFYVKSRMQFTWKRNLLFMISLILAVYTHYFSILFCIVFFLFDL